MSRKPIDPQGAVEWRAVSGWPEYEVSRDGRVRRVTAAMGTHAGNELKPTLMKKTGYLKVGFSRFPLREERLLHRVVAEAFIGAIPEGKEVCHDDGDKTNCNDWNLRIDTRKGNMADQIRHGKTPRGVKSGSNKYPQDLVVGIRCALANGFTVTALSDGLGIPKSTLYGIQRRQTWGWM